MDELDEVDDVDDVDDARGRREARGRRDAPSSGSQVTPRQRQVLRLVARGLSLEDIASLLVLDLATAQKEAREAITRLGLDTQQDIVAWHRALTAASDD